MTSFQKVFLIWICALMFFTWKTLAADVVPCTLEIHIDGVIGPGIEDYVNRAVGKAQSENCGSILVLMNTPGGELQSTHAIVEKILNSPIPFLCLVSPHGAHAGSAGAIILQACHVNGALSATNIGAATPIQGNGKNIGEDLRKKMLNDTVSWLQGMTDLRKRNLDFSKKIITEAKAVSSEEAYKTKAIDFLSDNIDGFLKDASNKKVLISEKDGSTKEVSVQVGTIKVYPTDSRYFVLQMMSDPELSYMIFMGSLGLLYFEFTHPGMIAPGVFGSIGLVLSLMSFHKLDVWWGGLALILLGILMLVLEMFVTSFGILGFGGVISFVIGGLFLFDNTATAYHLPILIILPTAAILGSIMIGIGILVLRNRKLRVQTGSEEMIGRRAKVHHLDDTYTGQIKVFGERWKFESSDILVKGDIVEVTAVDGLTLKVKKL